MTVIWEEDDDLAVQDELGWIPKDDGGAEWCLRKIREADADLATMRTHYEKQLKLVQERHDQTVAKMQGLLRKYLQKMEQDGVAKKTKTQTSYELPTGRLIRKAGGIEYKRDKAKLLEWLKASKMQEFIKTQVVQDPDWAGLKKGAKAMPDGTVIFEETGEVISGVEAIQQDDTFKVELV